MATTLVNLKPRPKVIVLDHQTFRKGVYGHRRYVRQSREVSKDGAVAIRETKTTAPGSLTLGPGERREGLHDDIAKVPDVIRLRAAGDIRLIVEGKEQARKRAVDQAAEAARVAAANADAAAKAAKAAAEAEAKAEAESEKVNAKAKADADKKKRDARRGDK